jgi:hypothetical protein
MPFVGKTRDNSHEKDEHPEIQPHSYVDELFNSPTSTTKKLDSLIIALKSSYQVLNPSRTLL